MNVAAGSERIAIVELADDLQVRKQRIFKILPRLGIRPTQRREPERGNQNVATVSASEAAAIRAEIQKAPQSSSPAGVIGPSYADDVGFFYLIQLEPEHDPGRFKLGFTMDLDGRLQKHRCSAPFAQYSGTWLCKRTWERAAIDSSTAGCDQLHTEVFRAPSLIEVSARASAFFSVMPALEQLAESDDQSQSPSPEVG